MSETCGAGCCNPPEKVKIGTVGPPAPDIEIKLADDGEVRIRGPIIMKGYRNAPDKTKETIDDDGWLHTGDIGELDEDGYLKIVDRKKELIINAGGKNMSPANIEAKVKASSPLIGQAIAIGDGRPYNVALITLDPDKGQRVACPGGGDKEVQAPARGLGAGRRGADAHDEAEAQADCREVQGRDRGSLRLLTAPFSGAVGTLFRYAQQSPHTSLSRFRRPRPGGPPAPDRWSRGRR
jgi:long-subunit acyl-CoA synthetase (AMP-forming)